MQPPLGSDVMLAAMMGLAGFNLFGVCFPPLDFWSRTTWSIIGRVVVRDTLG